MHARRVRGLARVVPRRDGDRRARAVGRPLVRRRSRNSCSARSSRSRRRARARELDRRRGLVGRRRARPPADRPPTLGLGPPRLSRPRLDRRAGLARDADLTEELGALHRRGLPVVVVWAPRDGVITEASFAALKDALRGARTITVPGDHNWLLADPDRFGEVITNVVEVADRTRWLRRGRARRQWHRLRERIRTAVTPARAE